MRIQVSQDWFERIARVKLSGKVERETATRHVVTDGTTTATSLNGRQAAVGLYHTYRHTVARSEQKLKPATVGLPANYRLAREV
jgi:hypothetical protein